MSELRISTERVCFIIAKSRAFHAKITPVMADDASNMTDDEGFSPAVMEDRGTDGTEQELREALHDLNPAELADILGLMWLGREGGDEEDWPDIMAQVEDQRPEHPVDYLVQSPLLGDFLDEGLEKFGFRCEDSGEPVAAGTRLRPD